MRTYPERIEYRKMISECQADSATMRSLAVNVISGSFYRILWPFSLTVNSRFHIVKIIKLWFLSHAGGHQKGGRRLRYRKLGTTNIEVSEIGFGGFAIGGYDYGPTDDRDSLAAIEKAYNLGVTFFDTADMYGEGRSESLIGRALKGKNPPAVVATKVGYVGERDKHRKDFSRAHILAAAEQSLKRLQRETIDLYQLHNPTLADLESGEAFGAMDELVQAGKVRFWGVSLPSRDVVEIGRRALTWPSAASLQIIYNLFHSRDLEKLQTKIHRQGIGVVARAPLEYGMLTGKFCMETRFAPGDHRNWRWKPEEFSRRLYLVEILREAFKGKPFTLSQLAMGFALSNPAVSVVICGAKRPAQIEDNVAASDLLGGVLTEADIRKARDLMTV
jgi:aryl-alcohol dehydrogenase-like predicted oxidoreductase